MINQGDAASADGRAQLIAKHFKKAGADSILAPTPPFAGFRLPCSSAASRRPDEKKRKLFIIDIKRAFLHAQARKPTYVKPPHLRKTTRCWKALKAMYGTFSAVGDFEDEVRESMTSDGGMNSGLGNPTVFPDVEGLRIWRRPAV